MEIFGILWLEVIMRPMINSLALLYKLLFNNFGLSIIVFTILIRLAMIPLTVRQTRQMKKMQGIQPKLKAIQEKYKGEKGDARRAMSTETMALYKTAGVSPIGCLGPMIVQMPIWIGFYRAILRTMPSTPEGLANLSGLFYGWNPAISSVPFDSQFLGISLVDLVSAAAVPWNYALPLLVGASMFLQQKMTTNPTSDPRQRQTNQMMLWMMPLMLTFFSFSLPSGLSLYWVASNLIQIGIQYFITGWGNLLPPRSVEPAPQTAPAQPVKEMVQNGDTGSDGKVRRGSNRDRPRPARRRAKPGRSRRNQPR